MKFRIIILSIFLCPFVSQGQKIKYKDLFPLLEAGSYGKAEKDLMIFVSDPKNDDEGNAFYHAGVLMEMKLNHRNGITDTTGIISAADSALRFFKNAIKYIDEKELKKNDEYYQSFYRRDLRSGEFGIKLSDVHLDIEKKIETIENYANSSIRVHQMLNSLKETESSIVNSYNSIVSAYDGFNDFVLKATPDHQENLETLQDLQDQVEKEVNELIEVAATVESGYYERFTFIDVKDFSAIEPILEIYGEEQRMWNVGSWASSTKADIGGPVALFKTDLQTLDEKINSENESLVNGELITVSTEIDELLLESLNRFDPDGFPKRFFNTRILENMALSQLDTTLNPLAKDSTQIEYQLALSDSILSILTTINDSFEGLDATLSVSEDYYPVFYYERYQGVVGVEKYLKKLKKWTSAQIETWTEANEFWDFRSKWGMSETDTIPLLKPDASYEGNYLTMNTLELDSGQILVLGMKLGEWVEGPDSIDIDTLRGFMAKFGVDRKLIWESAFTSSMFVFEDRNISISDVPEFQFGRLLSGVDDLTFYLFRQYTGGADDLTIVSVNLETGELFWNLSRYASREPVNSDFSAMIRQTTVFLYPQEAYPLPGDDLGYIVIDRNGKAQ